jgi:hypothetical protein
MNKDGVPSPIPDVIWRVPDDNAVLVSPQGGQVTILNEVGTTIWSLINGQNSLADIAEQLVRQYDVSFVQAYQDIENFITKLDERRLIIWE